MDPRADMIKSLRRIAESSVPQVSLEIVDGQYSVKVNQEYVRTAAESEETHIRVRRMQSIIDKLRA